MAIEGLAKYTRASKCRGQRYAPPRGRLFPRGIANIRDYSQSRFKYYFFPSYFSRGGGGGGGGWRVVTAGIEPCTTHNEIFTSVYFPLNKSQLVECILFPSQENNVCQESWNEGEPGVPMLPLPSGWYSGSKVGCLTLPKTLT